MSASIASLLVFLLSVWKIEALPGVALQGMGGGGGGNGRGTLPTDLVRLRRPAFMKKALRALILFNSAAPLCVGANSPDHLLK